jgi:hypothetical protein
MKQEMQMKEHDLRIVNRQITYSQICELCML